MVVSAGRDAGKLPGRAEGRLLQSDGGFWKGAEEASDGLELVFLYLVYLVSKCSFASFLFLFSFLAADPTITCLSTSLITERLVFWLFPTMM